MAILRQRKILFLILPVLIIGAVFYFKSNPRLEVRSPNLIHVTKYTQEAGYVEDTVAKFQNAEKLEFSDTFGGITSHHVPTAFPLLAEFYSRLKNTKNIDTFIVLGPDHWEKGRADVSISEADFITPFGKLSPDMDMIKKLEESRFVVHDEAPFEDHSIHSQLLFIAKLFPDAKIVPIVFRSSTANEYAEKLGDLIASLSGPNTFVVGSVDFSHYLNEEQARPLDARSATILAGIDPRLAGLTRADSPASLTALVAAVKKMGATASIPIGAGSFNSADFSNVNDFTTGYVVQFFGTKKEKQSSNTRDGTMLFVGDIMLSRSVGAHMQEKGDYNLPFLNIADFLKGADITFANLENPVSLRGTNVGSKYSFRADPKTIGGLNFAGIDIVSIANNHMWDYGREAFLDTMTHLAKAGIDFVGGGHNFEEAHRPVIKDVKGTKVAFLAYTEFLQNVVAGTNSAGITNFNIEQIKKDIAAANQQSDLVAVSFHWGDEYQTKHNQKQEQFAKAAIDAGADLIIGHHPHVVQEVEQYKDGWIAYSLGNFIFDQNFSKETMQGLALQVNLKDAKVQGVEKIDISISKDYQPSLSYQ
ncbi:MAG: AmmeMemoRadiSam system protein B [Candidatus Yanofskybacteria bacterium RIFCSPHIGHO2_02_FULL_41_11]|uniref:AmmeMemoRadiSam system protein B n=1 Tax=Candidatus Yanofskybacteria bacterium RIFCSPHIGHO2_02_FULL_41_11 TaxID=1802675 RepID=A0A1F8F7Q9_9BACT|nr:MAG: AmmeMemoRadiSam system protein B [Candidatus Yanofskybacteria bacterium RIFCSPHIGHO2_02_FULL_41_11]